MDIPSILACIGLLGLVAGFFSVRYLRRFKRSSHASPAWEKIRIVILVLAVCLGILSFPAILFFRYPITPGGNTLHVVGFPFAAAFFDSKGRDYVGSLTLLSLMGNMVFWFFVPHILFALYTLKTCQKGVKKT